MQNNVNPKMHPCNHKSPCYDASMINPMDTKSLRPAREKARLTRAQLAEAAGVKESTIWRIENGKVDPVSAAWRKIIKALGGK